MSITDINNGKLNAIRNSLAKSQGFQFSDNLKAVFDPKGHRQAVDPSWLKSSEKTRLEPIIIANPVLRPIMSKHSHSLDPMSSSSSNHSVDRNDPMEEDMPDLTPLIESMSIFSTISSSQLQMEAKTDRLENLVKLSQMQLKNILPSINMSLWADDIIADLLKEISKSESIPSVNAAYLVYSALYSKINLLKSNVPRILMNSIQQLAKAQGKCIIDGLIVPLLFQSSLGKPQCEVINKSISELNPSQRLFLLRLVLSDGEAYFTDTTESFVSNDNRNYLRPWNDSVFQIISTILSTQPFIDFDKDHLFDLVQPLQTIVQSNPKDKGSMQLLLLLTSKYTQAIVEFNCIDLIQEICQSSTMFLKRAVLGQLTSAKKKISGLTT